MRSRGVRNRLRQLTSAAVSQFMFSMALTVITVIVVLPFEVRAQGEFLSKGESGGGLAVFGVSGDGLKGVQGSAGVSHKAIFDFGFHYSYLDGGDAGANTNGLAVTGDLHLTKLIAPRAPVVVASIGYANSHHNYSDSDVRGLTIGTGIYYRIPAARNIHVIPHVAISAVLADGTHTAGTAGISYAVRSKESIVSMQIGFLVSEDLTAGMIGLGLARVNPHRRWR